MNLEKSIRHEDKNLIKELKKGRCIISGRQDPDIHHVLTVGSGGPDLPWNLLPIAHRYHQEVHQTGLNKFAQRYSQVRLWLISNGWTFCLIKNKWIKPHSLPETQ